MAQGSIPPSPASMSRRNPLTNLPNAVNSPYQVTASTIATGKRSRSTATTAQRDPLQPPSKRQALDGTERETQASPAKRQAADSASVLKTPQRRSRHTAIETKVPAARRTAASTRPRNATAVGPPAFANLGQATRHAQPSTRTRTTASTAVGGEAKHDGGADDGGNIRAWQKHYRSVFPSFVFFFENVPQDCIVRAQRHINTLGARCEKFFSSKVTHVITTRTVDEVPKTRSRVPGEKPKPYVLYDDTRSRSANDILLKAWDYNMKIWALEKLQRVLNGLLDLPLNGQILGIPVTNTGESTKTFNRNKAQGTLDLSHLLKNERLHGPTDRDPNAVSKDLIHFKGPFIYVYDYYGHNRPTMVRDYPKVPRREDGTWPQFRSVSSGKCPFIEESVHQRRERERGRERERIKAKEEKEAKEAARKLKDQSKIAKKEVEKEIKEVEDIAVAIPGRRSASVESRAGKRAFAPPPLKRTASRQENTVAFTATNQEPPGKYTHEPIASGLQPSNVTSAIRSHLVSSRQDQPGTRAGMSKEIYGLQRKVAGNVLLGNPRAPAAATAASLEPPRPAKRARTEPVAKQANFAGAVVKKAKKPDPKPGYCENCREKFDDFEDHCISRKHRKFALDPKNWEELDDLLDILVRPLKEGYQEL